MEPFVFQIADTFATPDGFDGEVTLAGVRVRGGDLAVGDSLLVPVRTGGRVRATCAGFPLLNFANRDWRAVSISGVSAGEVSVGDQAERC